MRLLAFLFCAVVVAMGAVGLFAPARIVAFARRFQSQQGLYLAAAIRLAFGGALVLVAPEARLPNVVFGLGVFLIAAGVITPFFGPDRFGRILDWWAGRSEGWIRAWCVFALLFGLAVARAVGFETG
ncbi:MAG: hypothetical protein AAF430_17180 [Myxococcota bacterium]